MRQYFHCLKFVIGILGREEKETRMKDVCIEIMMKMSKCGKIHQFKISIQEIKFNKINSKKIMLRHITIKFLKTEMNKNI